MNLKKVEKNLAKFLNDKAELGFDFKREGNKLTASCTLEFNDLGTSGLCSFTFFNNWATFDVYFDDIDATPDVCVLVNNFNKDALFFKACADEFLVVENTVALIDDGNVVEYVSALLDELVSDDFTQGIKPLIDLTYERED